MDNQFENMPMPPAPPKPKRGLHVVTLIFVVLIFIVTSLILANEVYNTYFFMDYEEEVAETQGNLGNYNVECVKNTLTEKADGSYTLTAEMKFINYGSEGRSFNEAVEVSAYQNDKEVPMTYDYELIVFDEEEAAQPSDGDEADLRVRNGRDAEVVLTYEVENSKENILIEMTSGDYSYTYTINLEG